MSILIKGMEMPKNCHECRFVSGCYCKAAQKKLDLMVDVSYIRDTVCPLIELPPHGDLIDRDELTDALDRLCDRVCQYSKPQRAVMCGACPLGHAFTVVEDDAPVVVFADNESKQVGKNPNKLESEDGE